MSAPYAVSVGAPVTGNGDDTISLNIPAGALPGDIMIAVVNVDAGVGQTIASFQFSSNLVSATFAESALGVRRGAAGYSAIVTGSEPGSWIITANTGGLTAAMFGGTILIRDGVTVSGIHLGTAVQSSGTTPGPASMTTTDTDELLLAGIAYGNTGTITNIGGTTGWAQFAAAANDGANSVDWQYVQKATAAAYSGGTATLGTSGQYGIVNCAIKPLYPGGDRYARGQNAIVVG